MVNRLAKKRFSLLEKFVLSKAEREDIEKYAPTRKEAEEWGLVPKKKMGEVKNVSAKTGVGDPWGSRCRNERTGRFISKKACKIRMNNARRKM